jgi:hypothetical protein
VKKEGFGIPDSGIKSTKKKHKEKVKDKGSGQELDPFFFPEA